MTTENRDKEHADFVGSSEGAQVFRRSVIVAVVVAWVVLFLSVVVLSLVSREHEILPDDTESSLVLHDSFSLQHAPASSIRILSDVPVRVEDGGLAVLDAGGREQSFIQYPYRSPNLYDAGDALIIAPRNKAEIVLLLPDLTMLEISAEVIVQGGDYRDGYVLLLGQAANDVSKVSLYKTAQADPLLTLSFSEQGRPIRVSFAKSGRYFDVLLVDFSEGTPVTRVQRFDFTGGLVADRRYPDFGFMPAILQLHDEEQVLFGESDLISVNPQTGDLRLSHAFDRLVETELSIGCLGIRAMDGGRMSLWFLRETADHAEQMLIEAEGAEEIVDFALSGDGVCALGVTADKLILFDTMTGKLIAERDGLSGMERVLAIAERNFLVLTAEEASIVSIR